jgi:hypothetical protein
VEDDRETARRALDFQARAQDYDLADIPGYEAWSERKLDEGESPALIAHLDATSMRLLPEEVAKVTDQDFEDMLDDLRAALDEPPD